MVLIPGTGAWCGNTGCGQARIDAAVTGGYGLRTQTVETGRYGST
jgi:hypothetical protein